MSSQTVSLRKGRRICLWPTAQTNLLVLCESGYALMPFRGKVPISFWHCALFAPAPCPFEVLAGALTMIHIKYLNTLLTRNWMQASSAHTNCQRRDVKRLSGFVNWSSSIINLIFTRFSTYSGYCYTLNNG